MKNANADEFDYPPREYSIDPKKITGQSLSRFISLVRANASEKEIDTFLRKNLPLLALSSDFFHTGHHGTWIIPQAYIKPPGFSNGPGKIPDYLFAGDNSDGVTWWVVEMKAPKDQLYKINRDGRAVETDTLRDAIAQTRDYIAYCERQQAFIRDGLKVSTFSSPFGVIVIGRESELYEDKRKQEAKATFNKNNHDLSIRTYDSFVRRIKEHSRVAHSMPFLSKIYLKYFIKDELSYWE